MERRTRRRAPVVAANMAEQRIIDLELFMTTTSLRGDVALIAFNAIPIKETSPWLGGKSPEQTEANTIAHMARMNAEIVGMRGSSEFWRDKMPWKGISPYKRARSRLLLVE